MKKLICLFLIVFTLHIQAQQGNISPPDNHTFSAYSLTVAPDASGIGRGYSGAATVADANATYWNLAALSFYKEKWGAAYSYMPWWKGHHYLAGFYCFKDPRTCLGFRKDRGVIAASIRYANLGDFSYSPVGGEATIAKMKELSADIGYVRSITQNLAIGLAVRYFRGDISLSDSISKDTYHDANAFSGDISAAYQHKFLKKNTYPLYLQVGARLSNFGTKFSYFDGKENALPLPMNLRLGASVKQELDDKNTFTLSLEGNKVLPLPRNNFAPDDLYALGLSTALDYNYKKKIYARVGFNYQSNHTQIMGYGLGYNYKIFSLQAGVNQKLKGNKPPSFFTITFIAQFIQTKTPFQLRKKKNILF